METNERIFVNTPMDPELIKKLDEMVRENESSRAQFIRLLVRKQYNEFAKIRKPAVTKEQSVRRD